MRRVHLSKHILDWLTQLSQITATGALSMHLCVEVFSMPEIPHKVGTFGEQYEVQLSRLFQRVLDNITQIGDKLLVSHLRSGKD